MEKFTKHYQDVQRIKSLPVTGGVKKFSLNHKAVYFHLLSWVESTGDAFPSLSYIEDALGTPKRTIQNILDDLVEFNIVRKEHRAYTSTRYHPVSIAEVMAIAKQANGKEPFYIATLPLNFMRIIDSVLQIIESMMTPTPHANTQQDASGGCEQKKLTLPTPYKSESVRGLLVEPVASYPWDDEGTDWGDYMHCPTTGRWVKRNEAIPLNEEW